MKYKILVLYNVVFHAIILLGVSILAFAAWENYFFYLPRVWLWDEQGRLLYAVSLFFINLFWALNNFIPINEEKLKEKIDKINELYLNDK